MDNWGPAVMWEHAELGWDGVGVGGSVVKPQKSGAVVDDDVAYSCYFIKIQLGFVVV